MGQEFIDLLETYGPATFACILLVWFLYITVLPAFVKVWQDKNASRLEEEKLDRIQAAEDRKLLLEELLLLRKDSRADKQLMYDAFKANTAALQDLKDTQAAIRLELTEVRQDVNAAKKDIAATKQDVREVYRIVGTDKKIIS